MAAAVTAVATATGATTAIGAVMGAGVATDTPGAAWAVITGAAAEATGVRIEHQEEMRSCSTVPPSLKPCAKMLLDTFLPVQGFTA